jgi:hypothetical protein
MMRITTPCLVAASFATALLALSAPANARCYSDSDCKGDRVCVRGECEDPLPAVESHRRVEQRDLRFAVRKRGGAFRAMTLGWLSFGVGAGLGIGAIATGAAGVETAIPVSLGGAGILCFAISGPLAAAGGTAARRGGERLRLSASGAGLRTTGWIFYGVGLGGAVAAVLVGAATESPVVAIVGVAPLLLCMAGTILLEIDLSRSRRMLVEAIDELRASSDVGRREGAWAVYPWLAPSPDRTVSSGGLALAVTW